jgi:hypothetical protein
VAARSVGYAIGAIVNATLLQLVNVRPGWDAVPFLTGDTRQVLLLVNLSLAFGLVTNLVYLAYDAPWLKAAGDVVGSAIALTVLVRLWDVFPFAFTGSGVDWAAVTRVVLAVAVVGTVVAIVVQFVSLVKRIAGLCSGMRAG